MNPASALAYARTHQARFLTELMRFVSFPSVSAQPKHAGDMRRCADWLAAHLRRIGLRRVKILPTRLHPIVYAEWCGAPRKPTILIYGHYDVQPADPASDWRHPPFDPFVESDTLYGRGSSDDKGQMYTHVKGIESLLGSHGKLPLNVKCLFEGEEEILSPNLTGFIERNRAALAADVAVLSDSVMLGINRPSITYSMRGQLGLELEVRGPRHDLHSGNFGGAVHDPLQALCEIVAQLHDRQGRIAIPGFYENVRPWSDQERLFMRQAGPRDEQILRYAETESGWGEPGYTLYERLSIRPSLAVTGISGGYSGAGTKAVIPSRAIAKFDFRLVPDQDPRQIEALFRRHIAQITPPSVKSAVRSVTSAKAALADRHHPAMRAAVEAYRRAFGRKPEFQRCGGTIPVVSMFQQMLGVPTVLMGFALPSDRMHAPDERLYLPNFYRGIETSIWFLSIFGEGKFFKTDHTTGRNRSAHHLESLLNA